MKRILILFLALIGIFASNVVAQDLSDIELLTALDDARFFDETVTKLSIRILSETPDETREAELMLSFYDTEDGSYARIEFATPEELKQALQGIDQPLIDVTERPTRPLGTSRQIRNTNTSD